MSQQSPASATNFRPRMLQLEDRVTPVVINEFLAAPAMGLAGDANGDGTRSATQDQFVELYNEQTQGVNISNWTISDDFGVRHRFAQGTVIPAKGTIVVFGGGNPTGQFGNSLVNRASTGALGFNVGGDVITVSNAVGATQATVTYGSEANNGQSLNRNPDITGTTFAPHSLVPGSIGRLFSPGTFVDGSNFFGNKDITPPRIVTSNPMSGLVEFPVNGSITLTFNERVAPGFGSITLRDVGMGTVLETINVNSNQVQFNGNMVVINPSNLLPVRSNISVRIGSVAIIDFAGNRFAGINNDKTLNFTTVITNQVDAVDDAYAVMGSDLKLSVPALGLQKNDFTLFQYQESFETQAGTTYTLSSEFNNGSSDFFGRFAVPDNSNTIRRDFQSGFDGGFAIFGQDHDGSGQNKTQTVTIPNLNIEGVRDGRVYLALGARDDQANDTYELSEGDGIKIFATVDGGTRTLIGEFAPPSVGNAGGINQGSLRLDTDGDGIGDGATLTTTLRNYGFNFAETGKLLTVEIELTSTSPFEPLVLDNVRILGNRPGTTTLAQPPIGGTVVVNTDGSFDYTPTPGFNGTDIFTYTLTDGVTSDTATVFIDVTDNAAPMVVSFANDAVDNTAVVTKTVLYTVTFDEPIDPTSLTLADFTNAGTASVRFDSLVFVNPSTVQVRVVPLTPGSLTLQIPAGAMVLDAFGNALETPVVDPTTLDVIADVVLPELVSITDDDADGTILIGETINFTVTFSEEVDRNSISVADFNNAGTALLAIDSVTPITGNVFNVVARAESLGSIILQIPTTAMITDLSGNLLATPVQDDTTLMAVDRPPILLIPIEDRTLFEDAPSFVIDLAGRFDDAEAGANTLVYFIAENTNPGLVTTTIVNGTMINNVVTPNAFGSTTITVAARDLAGNITTNSYNIAVLAVNDAPVFTLSNTALTIQANSGPLTFNNFATNINLGPNESQQVGTFLVTTEGGLRFTQAPTIDGNGTLRFTTAANSAGQSTVTVTLMDSGGTQFGGTDTSMSQQFTINATPRPIPPIANNDRYQFNGTGPFIVSALAGVLVNDTPAPLFVVTTGMIPTENGLVTLNPDGSFVYTPNVGFFGADSFAYTISDGVLTSSATATLTTQATPGVPPVNPPVPPVPPVNPPVTPPVPPINPAPPTTGDEFIAVGSGVGQSGSVVVYNQTGNVLVTMPVFNGFTGGVRVATGDFNGDGIPDILAGAGPGGGPIYTIIDGLTRTTTRTDFAFEPTFTGGIYVAAGDVNGDGIDDIILTPDQGGGPRVRILDGKTNATIVNFFGIDDPAFRGGARAALGDVNADGRLDLIVAAGFGGGPRVAVYDGANLQANGGPKLFNDFFAFEQELRNGVFVASGDVDGDGFGDLVIGGGPGGGPRVQIFSGASLLTGGNPATTLGNFFAGTIDNRGGVRVAVKDIDNDNRADIVTGPGPGEPGRANVYLGSTITPNGTPPVLATLTPFDDGFLGGLFVG